MKRADSGARGVYWRPTPAGSQSHPDTGERGHWWILWFCRFGHRHREQIGPRSVAEAKVDNRRVHRSCPAHEARARGVLLADAVRDYLRDHAHKRSAKDDRRHGAFWVERFGHQALDEVTRADVRKVRTARLAEVTPATCNRALAFLRRVFNVQIEDRELELANPVRKMTLQEPSGRVRYLTDDEEPRLMAVLAPWERDRVVVLYDTGLRKSEFLGLRVRDVDFKAGVLTIPRSKHGERRTVPMTSRVRTILRAQPRTLDSSALVFPNREGNRDLRWVEKRFPAACREAGLHNFRFHDLRHTFASRLAMAGVDLKTLKELGGWKTLSMVERYAHLSGDHLRSAVERLVSAASELKSVPPGVPPARDA